MKANGKQDTFHNGKSANLKKFCGVFSNLMPNYFSQLIKEVRIDKRNKKECIIEICYFKLSKLVLVGKC